MTDFGIEFVLDLGSKSDLIVIGEGLFRSKCQMGCNVDLVVAVRPNQGFGEKIFQDWPRWAGLDLGFRGKNAFLSF